MGEYVMKKTLVISLCVLFTMTLFSAMAFAKEVPGKKFQFSELPQVTPPPAGTPGPLRSSAAADTFNLGWFGFDVLGLPNPQGWVTVDLTQQQTFFHVASNTPVTGERDGGTFGNLVPLDGNKSLWLGQAASL